MAKAKVDVLKKIVGKIAEKSNKKESKTHEKGESKPFQAGENEEEKEGMRGPSKKFKNLVKK